MLEAERIKRQQPSREMARQATELDQLVALMDESGNKSAAIKNKLGYRSLKIIISIAEVLCCSNLYSFIGTQSHWIKEGTGRPDLVPSGLGAKPLSSGLARHPRSVGEMNERLFGRKRSFTVATLMSRLLLAVCVACELGLGISTYFQYHLDYYQFHLFHLNTSLLFVVPNQTKPRHLPTGFTYERALVLEQELRLEEQMARVPLKTTGSFLMNHPYYCEAIYLFLMTLCGCTYLAPMVKYAREGSFDIHYLRLLVDWGQEQLNCNPMIEFVVKRFVLSSENLTIAPDQGAPRNAQICFKSELLTVMNRSETGHQFFYRDDTTSRPD